jgi:prepilin-type N-terminal cleavage/methylation domain-containing protein
MVVSRHPDQGFSLIELAIVVTIIGLMLLVSIPAYHALSQDQQLHGAAQSVVGQVQLARVSAMSTGRTQNVNFNTGVTPPTITIFDTVDHRSWTLPRGISFASGGANSFTVTRDGRASSSQYIVLQNNKGNRDTVSVQTSGYVIARH